MPPNRVSILSLKYIINSVVIKWQFLQLWYKTFTILAKLHVLRQVLLKKKMKLLIKLHTFNFQFTLVTIENYMRFTFQNIFNKKA
jgi:hypothetical protein